jgi:hypothetical protein
MFNACIAVKMVLIPRTAKRRSTCHEMKKAAADNSETFSKSTNLDAALSAVKLDWFVFSMWHPKKLTHGKMP